MCFGICLRKKWKNGVNWDGGYPPHRSPQSQGCKETVVMTAMKCQKKQWEGCTGLWEGACNQSEGLGNEHWGQWRRMAAKRNLKTRMHMYVTTRNTVAKSPKT